MNLSSCLYLLKLTRQLTTKPTIDCASILTRFIMTSEGEFHFCSHSHLMDRLSFQTNRFQDFLLSCRLKLMSTKPLKFLIPF